MEKKSRDHLEGSWHRQRRAAPGSSSPGLALAVGTNTGEMPSGRRSEGPEPCSKRRQEVGRLLPAELLREEDRLRHHRRGLLRRSLLPLLRVRAELLAALRGALLGLGRTEGLLPTERVGRPLIFLCSISIPGSLLRFSTPS